MFYSQFPPVVNRNVKSQVSIKNGINDVFRTLSTENDAEDDENALLRQSTITEMRKIMLRW